MTPRILIACERSNQVRSRFEAKGFDAWSCDLDWNAKLGVKHYREDVLGVIAREHWDAMIAFPPCTHLAVSGNQSRDAKAADGRTDSAVEFFMKMIDAPIRFIAVENPIGIMSTKYRKPDQIVQPYFFGDASKKSTCLWLKNLPKLFWTDEADLFSEATAVKPELITIKGQTYSKHEYEASKNKKHRQQIRSHTFSGIAQAMADQWSEVITNYIVNH